MQEYWLAFTHVHGLGPVRLRQLRARFETLKDAWYADTHTLYESGLPQAVVEDIQQLRKRLEPRSLLDTVQRLGAWVVTLDDENYPPLLREINDAPVVLYGIGELLPEDQLAIAVVGTRRASAYGKEMTRQLVQELVENNVTIVSGLAYGIDIHAHRIALENRGRTIAVLGSGIDILYPSEHRETAREIAHSGAVITEFPPGTQPERGNFPARNRIISGLSLGTVVIEAPEESGSLQTANLAGEQGREVFAVPGNANSPNSRGTNLLIQDGAKLVLNGQDILKELNLAHRLATTRQTVQTVAPATPLETQILALLTTETLHVDELSRLCQLSVKDINATLAIMELKGMVYQIAPMTYQIK
jgi:DNA processing protein